MHRHEYSPPVEQHRRNSLPVRSPLSRSAYSTSTLPRKSPYPISTTPISTTSNSATSILQQSARPISEQLARKGEHMVRFQEPDWDTMSDDGRSVTNSEESGTASSRQKRRASRTSTAFHLALPAPTMTRKQRVAHIRPKLLLQLQRLSAGSRPRPVIDVLSSNVIIPKVAKKFPRMFRGKTQLGANDVMVMQSEDYDTPERLTDDTDSDDDGLATREVMAVICQMRRDEGGLQGKAEITLGDGSTYEATPLPNGMYEFVTMDKCGHRTTARWVKRPTRSAGTAGSGSEFKFTFSIIDPESRRHPIMASLTENNLEILDYYTSVSASSAKHPPTSINGASEDPVETTTKRASQAVGDDLKTLIQVTGVWVALREGLSPYFRYSDAMTPISTNQRVASRTTSLSLTPDSARLNPPWQNSDGPDSGHSSLGAVGDKFRRCAKASPSPFPSPTLENVPLKRAASAGPAFIARATARRAGLVSSESEGEAVYPPKPTHRMSMPLAPTMQCTPPTPDTPTQAHRRRQSSYVPAWSPQTENVGSPTRKEVHEAPVVAPTATDYGEKVKAGRWRTLTSFFRRSSTARNG